ncbi:predicted protein [Chaetomium globosum CBS 148.51]|uniref:Uncharacterized protein n=1 Tax=Chaetomium globosum (strain ATCC 6205 / CBS 148.51 / DSM 1962 / NBRC 6347 / NRRL 1970) TaxID=306901 RepID=Q2GRL5_CHAGB|nr:uncharacterized protein CHGG_09389 [Chaetomium globosum CBS 148.51]EAQ85375.1 predicted protein [Chaetomium globosum CBS 148.51]
MRPTIDAAGLGRLPYQSGRRLYSPPISGQVREMGYLRVGEAAMEARVLFVCTKLLPPSAVEEAKPSQEDPMEVRRSGKDPDGEREEEGIQVQDNRDRE